MPYLPNEREYRVMPILEKRTPEEGEERNEYLVEGYATTFGDPYLLFNWEGNDYYEVIDRDAIDQSTNMEDIIFQYDHGSFLSGRTALNDPYWGYSIRRRTEWLKTARRQPK